MGLTETIARDFLASGESFTSHLLVERYGIDISHAGVVIRQLEASKKYTLKIVREGRRVKSARVISIRDKHVEDGSYALIKKELLEKGAFITTAQLKEKYGLSQGTASSVMYRLKKDPTLNTEIESDGQVTSIRVTKKTEDKPLSKEASFWLKLTTKRWSDMALEVAA